MAEEIFERGDKLHIITRRLFAEDLRRHFVGVVTAKEGCACQTQGYTFVFNSSPNEYRRRPELCTRIFDLTDARLIVNKLPSSVDISLVEYLIVDKRLALTGEGVLARHQRVRTFELACRRTSNRDAIQLRFAPISRGGASELGSGWSPG